ncbi:peroxide stress protein YaaA [Pseudoruegeria sp. SK021]|uniref:peroxide stress protein YaaA n=1 Tax=Pseudoruegeria sp. SK021 TaxID=1933035 RepID=UPI000A2609B1|nr:peroxide stress protein YaaA [Pseudoruegeria sp. SK021]OSP55379.1 hypothetical protein BV911_08065 [Pseudoruegeria sp. SK021]
MLVVISPAKRLNWDAVEVDIVSSPAFQDDATALAKVAARLSQAELQKLMGISAPLAALNQDRFRTFDPSPEPQMLRPAAMAFAGDTYQGLDAASLDPDAHRWAQDHLRILSGLYGLLRPMDQIQPYRLEMGSRLKTASSANLYGYWGARLSLALNEQAEKTQSEVLVNCASTEYFTAVDRAALQLRVVTPVFLEDRDGVAKIVSFYAKKARGAMARFIVEQRLTDVDDLKDFEIGGYCYAPDRSEPDAPVFLRKMADSASAAA